MATGPPIKIASLTAEEEDKLIITRLANDEKTLRRLTKGFHTITNLSRASSSKSPENSQDPSSSTGKTREEQLRDAREAFLLDLDQFQMQLIKNMQVCDAEARMVEEYSKEKERIAQEHEVLIQDIAQLKLTLTEAHEIRKRRMEYDEIAEKINALPSRADSEAAVARHEEEVAVARAERDQRMAEMVSRGLEFDLIVNSIREIRTRGLSKEDSGKPADGTDGELRDAEGSAVGSLEVGEAALNPNAKAFQPLAGGITPHGSAISRPSTPRILGPSHLHQVVSGGNGLTVPPFIPTGPRSARSSPAPPPETLRRKPDDDIEMGEVAEEKLRVQSSPGRKRLPREDLEEGEASDGDSVLTDLPEDYL